MKRSYLSLILSFTLSFLLLSTNIFSQYLETFSIVDRGVLPGTCSGSEASCITNYSGVDWIINGDFTGMDANDFFSTNAAAGGRLHGDGDCDASGFGICFETPILDISGAGGPVSFSINLDWVSWDFGDIGNVEYQLNSGSWVTLPPLPGTDGPTTIDFNSDGNTGSGVASTTGLSGSTLSIRVCMITNSLADDLFIDNVSVPEAGVTVLPVELISFKAQKSQNNVVLNWATASEINNEKFEIEHSTTGDRFKKIGEITGIGTSIQTNQYSFIHKRPATGQSYYRLKQIDFDGKYEYSQVVTVNIEGKGEHIGTFYPNPSKNGIVNLDFISNKKSDLKLSIFDATGRKVLERQVEIIKGTNQLDFNFSNLAKGIYFAQLEHQGNIEFQKLIVN